MDPNAPSPEITPEVAPVVEPVVEPTVEPTTEPAAEDIEDKEWNDAIDEHYKEKEDEPAEPEEEPKKEKENPAEPEETEEQRAERLRQEAGSDDEGKRAKEIAAAEAARESRAQAREYQERVETLKTDIQEKLYANIPTRLQDADGDPINGPEDVMGLINPATQETFTAEEAGMWFLNAQRVFNENYQAIQKEIEDIAEVNIDVKDWADAINLKYEKFLQDNPQLRDELWADYQATLVVKDGVIVGAPVNMERFYERALKPYAIQAAKEQNTAEAEARAAQEAEAKAKADAEKARIAARKDRSDIYGGEKDTSVVDDDDKEWAEAAEQYYGRKV